MFFANFFQSSTTHKQPPKNPRDWPVIVSHETDMTIRLCKVAEVVSEQGTWPEFKEVPLEGPWRDCRCVKQLEKNEDVGNLNFSAAMWPFAVLIMRRIAVEGWDDFKKSFEKPNALHEQPPTNPEDWPVIVSHGTDMTTKLCKVAEVVGRQNAWEQFKNLPLYNDSWTTHDCVLNLANDPDVENLNFSGGIWPFVVATMSDIAVKGWENYKGELEEPKPAP